MKVLFLRYLAVGTAGAVGTLLRFTISMAFGRMDFRFPYWGTFVINVTGSMFLGWFLTYVGSRGISDTMRLAIGTGFVGGYTTFSTYMFESNNLLQQKAHVPALAYMLGSVIVGILGVQAGIKLAQWR